MLEFRDRIGAVRGWPPVPNSEVTCWPSTLRWNSRVSLLFLSGSGFSEFSLELAKGTVRLPGASIASPIQLRPFAGSSPTWRGSMLIPAPRSWFRSAAPRPSRLSTP